MSAAIASATNSAGGIFNVAIVENDGSTVSAYVQPPTMQLDS